MLKNLKNIFPSKRNLKDEGKEPKTEIPDYELPEQIKERKEREQKEQIKEMLLKQSSDAILNAASQIESGPIPSGYTFSEVATDYTRQQTRTESFADQNSFLTNNTNLFQPKGYEAESNYKETAVSMKEGSETKSSSSSGQHTPVQNASREDLQNSLGYQMTASQHNSANTSANSIGYQVSGSRNISNGSKEELAVPSNSPNITSNSLGYQVSGSRNISSSPRGDLAAPSNSPNITSNSLGYQVSSARNFSSSPRQELIAPSSSPNITSNSLGYQVASPQKHEIENAVTAFRKSSSGNLSSPQPQNSLLYQNPPPTANNSFYSATTQKFSFESVSWFHGRISEEVATERLKGNPIGTYLCRYSSQEGCLTLQFLRNGLEKVIIRYDQQGCWFASNTQTKKDSLDELAASYDKCLFYPLVRPQKL